MHTSAKLTACALALALSSTAAMAAEATADMKDAEGNPAGTVTMQDSNEGVLFQIELTGLAPGWHGFHVHQTGDCGDGFKAAGDHYAPEGQSHGLLADGGAHAGDLPNVYADGNGEVRAHVTGARLSVDGEMGAMLDSDGSAIIVHENPDSYGADAGAGGRVACGVIE
ncbi:MAG: superoxide dismutase [Pseudooceanicola sp.]|jgi:Cu-Zn family superoxide dismutase|nr:superoxide dismutase [Pseudooceanicola sp.]